jgi:hypothetical protein
VSTVLSKAGFRSLRLAWLTLVVALAVALALGFGSLWNVEREKRADANSQRLLAEARAKVGVAKRESEDLRASARIFEDLTRRGMMQEERRLEFLERLDQLKAEYRLTGLEYEILPQRPLPLAGNRAFNAVEVLASRMTMKVRALHEGELIGFIDALSRPDRGFHFVESCAMRRPTAAADPLRGEGGIQAECTLEWISLKDKRGKRAS